MPKVFKRLFGPALITNAAATKYTVPAATKTTVTHIHAANAVATDFTLSLGVDAAGTRLFDQVTIAAKSVLDHYCRRTMDATEVIQAFGSITNQIVLTIDGEEDTL